MGHGKVNIKHLIVFIKVKLYRHLFLAHSSFLRDVLAVFLLQNTDNDPMLRTVFWTASVTVDYCFKAVLICMVASCGCIQ